MAGVKASQPFSIFEFHKVV